jgi:parallel beta-helix repeat protein
MYKIKKYLFIFIFAILLLPNLLGNNEIIEPNKLELKKSMNTSLNGNQIVINGNLNFSQTAINMGWQGNGSKDDPYQISNISFDFANYSTAISLINTSLFFQIKVNDFLSTNQEYTAISLNNVSNGNISYNKFDNVRGLVVYLSKNQIVTNNNFNNSKSPLSMEDSNNNTIFNNSFKNSASPLFISISHFNVFKSNTFNGKLDAIVLSSSSNNMIENNYFNWQEVSVQISSGNNNSIKNNIFIKTQTRSITISEGANITIISNYFANPKSSILMDNLQSSLIENNTFLSNEFYTLLLESNSQNNNITKNDFYFTQTPVQGPNGIALYELYDNGVNNKFDQNYWNESTSQYIIEGDSLSKDDNPVNQSNIQNYPILSLDYGIYQYDSGNIYTLFFTAYDPVPAVFEFYYKDIKILTGFWKANEQNYQNFTLFDYPVDKNFTLILKNDLGRNFSQNIIKLTMYKKTIPLVGLDVQFDLNKYQYIRSNVLININITGSNGTYLYNWDNNNNITELVSNSLIVPNFEDNTIHLLQIIVYNDNGDYKN